MVARAKRTAFWCSFVSTALVSMGTLAFVLMLTSSDAGSWPWMFGCVILVVVGGCIHQLRYWAPHEHRRTRS